MSIHAYHAEHIPSVQALSNISLNAKYLVLLKNVRDRSQFSRLALQVYPKQSVDLYDSYLHATAKPHGYLVLDLSQDLRF